MNRSQCLATMAICFYNMTYNHRLLKHIDHSKKLWNSKESLVFNSVNIDISSHLNPSHSTSIHLNPYQSISFHLNLSRSISFHLEPSKPISFHINLLMPCTVSTPSSSCFQSISTHLNPSQPISFHLIPSHLLMPCTVSTPSSSPLSLSLHNHSTRDATSCCLDIVVSKFS